ncbi:hypothetical protein EKO04_003387 [Ascochyta lentis]|uniref:Uncharacterized protein n=1 Tax=Ascochyta lentis TaxID=205686 RepID=A0A8H7J8M1_9PLEO|nr:hypothetical protein EKO04_003387 [Ascochyta lentis]
MGDIEQQNDDLAASTKETPLSPPASGTRDDSTSIQGSIDSLTGDSRLHDTGDLSASLQPPVEEPHCEAPAVSTGNATAPDEDGNIVVTSLSREPVADSPLPPIPTAEATSEPSSPPSEDADAPSTLLEHSTLPEQEGNSVPLYAPVEQSVAEVVQKHVEIVEPPVKQDKGKGRAVSPPAPAQRRWSTSVLSPQKSDGLFRVPSMTLASSSGSDPAPLPRSPHITYAPKSGVGQISAIESADCDDYPRISNGLRTTYHKGMPPHKPRVPLSRVTGMSEYRRIVTKYAGEPLYQLRTALPYVLGPMFLITRLQLLVERKISLPDEVRELVARNGLDLASLSEYDVALLNVLGCLWDD